MGAPSAEWLAHADVVGTLGSMKLSIADTAFELDRPHTSAKPVNGDLWTMAQLGDR